MNIKNIYIGILSICSAIIFTACGGQKSNESITVTTSELEDAHNAGREAAREFINKNWTDTLMLQEALIEASSKGAPYDSIVRLRAAYDSAFIATVRTVNPDIASQLERYQKQMNR